MLNNGDLTNGLWGLSCQPVRAVTVAIEGWTALMTNPQALAAARMKAAQAVLETVLDLRLEVLVERLQAVEAALRVENERK